MEKIDKKNSFKNNYLLLNSIHEQINFLSKKDKNDSDSNNILQNPFSDNILIKYLNNNNILFDKTNLINFIVQLYNYSKNNENIIFPFLNVCPLLVKAYIESDIDEEKMGEYKYMNIFKILTKNTFINKESLFPIYSFFSNIFSDITIIKEDDIRLKKLIKIVDLWLIFYTFNTKEKGKNEYKDSSICFLGGSLNLHFKEEMSAENKIIEIKVNFFRNEYFNCIKEENSFLKINHLVLITYKDLQKYIKEKIYSLTIFIEHKKIIISFNYTEHSPKEQKGNKNKEKIKTLVKSVNLAKIKNIIFLDNFYGEVNSVEINLKKIYKKQVETYLENVYKPFLETNLGYLRKENDAILTLNKDYESSGSFKKPNRINMSLKITDQNFTKVNYINYGDNEFNIVEYFGNVVQLLPFSYIIQKLLINNNIKIINNENKNKICLIFLDKISQGFFNCILYNNYNTKIIKKYFLFVYSIILEIVKTYNNNNKEENSFNVKEILTNIFIFSNMHLFDKGEYLFDFYIKLINAFGDHSFESTIKELVGNVLVTEKKSYPYSDTEDFIKLYYILPENAYSQIYRRLMKDLFIYNRMWSQKEFFFAKKDNNDLKTIKYKQMNYYTRNFQQPILYPILEIDKYYPDFSQFKLENLYKNPNEKILNYNFSLSEDGTYINNIISKYIDKYLRKQKNQEKCCLVKKTHHVKGSISIIEMDYNGVDCFELYFFSSLTQNTDPICNNPTKKEEEKNESNSKNLCYGSVFPCPKKDYGIIFNIKSRDILFILIREYYHRVSGIEIFTIYNKSYFFNFNNFFTNNRSKNLNDLLKKISFYFESIKINIPKQESVLLGFYNPEYQQYLYPLFSEEINVWKKKNKCFSNYDKLIIINLLSNRSFKDIYQYPIFPMFYEHIGIKERDMNKHIGLLEINEESLQRKKSIIQSYYVNVDESKFQQEPTEVFLFNTHYSNPIYTCNYLIRIFPYSFIGIEFQGTGFDDPNRLFYSIPKTMINTLSKKSDYREMIPELFYMPEVFENGNNLQFKKISSGENIDNVQFSNSENNIKDIDTNKNNQNEIIYENNENFEKYKFLSEIRDCLDNEKKINQWIDLIFGVDQKENEKHQVYFEKQSHTTFENNSELYNNPLSLQSIDFGLIPFQLFYEKFPVSINHMQYFYQLNIENKSRFEIEHKSDHDSKQCFIYKGRSFISSKYLEIINDMNLSYSLSIDDEKNLNQNNPKPKIKYDFIGDVFGFVTIITKKIKVKRERLSLIKKNKENNEKNKKKSDRPTITIDNSNEENENNNMTKISDHYKQIKYIDYNPRLNLFLTYALDGYINIYTFPKIKLVRVIKIDNFYENDDYLKKVVLISNPFPMIFCHNETKMFVFSINGELIRSRSIEPGTEFIPSIDKDLGLIRDHVEMRIYQNNKNTVLSKELYFPLI